MTTVTGSPLHELAVATDTKLAELHFQLWKQGFEVGFAEERVREYAGQRKIRQPYATTYYWDGSLADAEAAAALSERYGAKEAIERLAKARLRLAEIKEEIRPLQATYEAHRWSRFFLVQHIHSSMTCSTCYPDTQYSWLPSLSGLTEADAVEQEGEILCTICFPSAPSAWKDGIGKRTLEARAQRDAEKAARLAAKAAKSLSLDGSEVEISAPDTKSWSKYKTFKTLRSAELWLTEGLAEEIKDARGAWSYYPDAWTEATKQKVLDLMSAKTGKSVGELLAEFTAKAEKKVKRDGICPRT